MPLSDQKKLALSHTILAKIAADVHVARDYEFTEDKTSFAVLSALRSSLGTSKDMLERFKRAAATCLAKGDSPDSKGVGACQNLSSYFALQYMEATFEFDVTLFYLSKSGSLMDPDNHAFVIIGPVSLGRYVFDEHQCSTAFEKGLSVEDFLSNQRNCIVVDPFYNGLFSITDEEKKASFIRCCADTPFLTYADFFIRQRGFRTKLADTIAEINSLAKSAYQTECLNGLNYIMPFLVFDTSSQWKIVGEGDNVKFAYTIPNFALNGQKVRDFLRLEDVYGRNSIQKQEKSIGVGCTKQITFFIMNPRVLSLYGIWFHARRLRDEFSPERIVSAISVSV